MYIVDGARNPILRPRGASLYPCLFKRGLLVSTSGTLRILVCSLVLYSDATKYVQYPQEITDDLEENGKDMRYKSLEDAQQVLDAARSIMEVDAPHQYDESDETSSSEEDMDEKTSEDMDGTD